MAARAPLHAREFYIALLNISLKSLCVNVLVIFIFSQLKSFQKMKKHIQYALAMLLVLLMACQKDKEPDIYVSCDKPTNDLALSRKLIIGTWRFKRYVFENANGITRKDIDTAQIDVKFTSNGILEYYEKGQLIDTCGYEIDIMKKYTLYPGDTTQNLLWMPTRKRSMLSALEYKVPLRICNDSLFLPYQSFAFHTIGNNYFFRLR